MSGKRSHRNLDATIDELVERGREPLPRRAELRRLRRRVGAAVAGGVVAGSAATAATGSAAAAATVAGTATGAVWLKMATAGALAVAAVTTTVAVTSPVEETPRPPVHQAADVATAADGTDVAALDDRAAAPPRPPGEAADAEHPVAAPSMASPEGAPEAAGGGLGAPSPAARRVPSPTRGDTAAPLRQERAHGAEVGVSVPQTLGVSLLRDARAALDTRPAHTLSLVDRHAAAFPGMLDQERELIAIEALLRLGRTDEGRARAERFAAEHPRSTYLPRLEALVTPR